MTENGPIPVTVVSGYLGAGKTTLINHVLSNPGGRRIAVIVNDMGEINVDADRIARENDEDGIVDLSNGCICCRLRGDLLEEARRLAERRTFDYLLVESSGISEPIPVAQVFTEGTDESDVDPTTLFRLDTMVTVLDTYGFWKEFDAGERLPEGAQPDADRPLSEVLVEGIEFCDVLLLNKSDMVPDDVLEEIEAVVETLQPRAKRLRTSYCEIDPDVVLDTGRFDFESAKRSQGWKRHLRGEGHDHGDGPDAHNGERTAAEMHGVSSFVFRSDRPFHPERLADWLEEWDGSIVRAKGVCYVADREDVIGVSQAGPSVRAGPIGEWRPDDDRRTQLVFIGREMDEERIREELEACVIAGDEVAEMEPSVDPFPL
ncbi:cobalamin synthesis protein P47K [Haloterrigena turkmenica DSM 5511]|uniref:Cobalamin synthesis protein P47K n=1 Tax=Haloterrigena turkmenica (strain ATCC 51198 / DSM 5511 / JCM 9101 / NCIMB 13204 / VKM B-1734 / 4k) TaxID=543526 RepID=D2RWW6_HALTV|nr:GTP-binding protein [Haloterrigena turkmenica]ADB59578.1 cobalamin synthesis protein P47K [Haloterrigena turkmenica DSM 5511]